MNRVFRVAAAVVLLGGGAAALYFALRRGDSRTALSGSQSVARGSRSVILITMDTTRADHLQPYGATDVETPTLARLAERGVVFENAESVAPITLVAHTAIHTGLFPPQTGVRNNGTDYVPDELLTLAERMKARGFATAGFVSGAVLDHRYHLDQGFDLYDDDLSSGRERHPRMVADRPAEATVASASRWLDALGADRKFFIWVHFYDPHAPYSPPAPYRDKYRERLYDGEIAYMDAQIGRLLAHPRVRAADPYLVLVADHGESLGEHGEQTHSILAYESTLHVPLLVVLPGGPGGVRVPARVSQVDIVPTLLDLLESAPDPALPGRSLLPLVAGAAEATPRTLYSETYLPFFTYGWAKLRVFRNGDFKFIDAPKKELYDLRRDPRELSNIIDQRPGTAHDLERDLTAFLGQAGDAERESSMKLDAETAEMLRSLGYLSVGSAPRFTDKDRPDPKDVVDVHVGLERARDLADQRLFAEATRVLEGILRRDPNNLAGLLDLATAEQQTGKLDDAVVTAEKALSIDPKYARTQLLLASLEARRGNRTKALALVDATIRSDPHSLEARLQKSALLAQAGKSDEAQSWIAETLRQNPEEPKVLTLYAQLVDLRQHDLGSARRHLEAALRRDPFFTQAWRELSQVEDEAGDAQAEEKALRSGLERSPDDADLHGRLGLLLARHHEAADAEAHLREGIRLATGFRADLEVALGALLAEAGKLEAAQAEYDKVLALDPHNPDARNNRAIALYRSGQLEEAKADLEQLVREVPRQADAWNNLSAIAVEEENWQAAEKYAREAISRSANLAEAWNNLGVAREQQDDPKEAEAAYQKALAIERDYWQAEFNLALLWAKQGKSRAAADALESILARLPNDAPAHLAIGRLYAGPLSDPARARLHLNAFLKLAPRDPEAAAVRRQLAELRGGAS